GPPSGDPNSQQWPQEWQFNRRLNVSMVPEWDGHGKTAISYLCKVAELVRLSPQVVLDLGALAPLKFTGRAEMWWITQTPTVRNYVSQSWNTLLHAIQIHFLNETWMQDRRSEYLEMRFRQRGHEGEWPLDFVQRRVRSHMFLYPQMEDGPAVVHEILSTCPTFWKGDLNSEKYASLFALYAAIRRHCATLMGSWDTAIKLRTLGSYYTRSSGDYQRSRNANIVEYDSDGNDGEITGMTPPPAEEDSKAAYAASMQRKRPRATPYNRPGDSASSKLRWPEGKTVRGYDFHRRDDVHSDRKPNGVCFVCSSPNHFARDCPHYGAWITMRDANMLTVEISAEDEDKDAAEYLVMLAERVNTTDSAY
ncbi:hypothetical protein C8R43DRAFT_842017, partial [Mycena crocata]